MRPLFVLRPEPGAGRTAERARQLGIDVHCAPLFAASPLAWDAPDAGGFDALLVTSAQGASHAGPALAQYRGLPAYAVGAASAAALRERGFADVIAGEGDGSAIAARIARDGHRAVLHLAGAQVAPIAPGPLSITRIPVYAMAETGETLDSVPAGAVLMIHSPRAGARIATLLPRDRRAPLHIVAISPAARAAAGEGWASAHVPVLPRDDEMLALAADVCK